MHLKKKKSGQNLTDKSTNFGGHDIVRKNDVVTNTDNSGETAVKHPNKHHVPTSTKDTSQ